MLHDEKPKIRPDRTITHSDAGGLSTVIAFAAQHVGMNLTQVVEDYAGLARKGAVVDYAFHMIVADPTEATVREHLPPLIRAGPPR